MKTALAALLFAASAAAGPSILRITPSHGPVGGGTVVTLTGTGFEIKHGDPRQQPQVLFSGVPSPSVRIIDSETIEAVAPPYLPQRYVGISVVQWNGVATLAGAFAYGGGVSESFERILLPLFAPPTEGAFGSRFVTQLRMQIENTGLGESTNVFGLQRLCYPYVCPDIPDLPLALDYFAPEPEELDYDGRPGRFIYIARNQPNIYASLRVADETRDANVLGTEIPIVREAAFRTENLLILGLPRDPRFRNTLRIYATEAMEVIVSFGGVARAVALRPGANMFDPAYGEFSEFPRGQGTFNLQVIASVSPSTIPMWAFVSVTDNDTQAITTITPGR